eukprot:6179643-Pleurochrysis_carterae.AAC.3
MARCADNSAFRSRCEGRSDATTFLLRTGIHFSASALLEVCSVFAPFESRTNFTPYSSLYNHSRKLHRHRHAHCASARSHGASALQFHASALVPPSARLQACARRAFGHRNHTFGMYRGQPGFEMFIASSNCRALPRSFLPCFLADHRLIACRISLLLQSRYPRLTHLW